MEVIAADVKAKLDILSCEEVAEKLGIEVKRHKALCFMHDDHHPSLSFFGDNRNRWWCFVCNKGGNAISMVMEATGYDFVNACKWLCSEFNIVNDTSTAKRMAHRPRPIVRKRKAEEIRPFNKEVAQWLLDRCGLTERAQHFLFDQRCLSQEVIESLKIKSIEGSKELVTQLAKAFDLQELKNSGLITETNRNLYLRMFSPCLLFPYFDQRGELVGLQSRYLGENAEAPRFQFISAVKTRMFNLPILNTMKAGDDLYISEGITDCLALLSAGKKAVAIPSATILPKMDMIRLRYFNLHMFPDQDTAGYNAFRKLNYFFVNLYTFVKKEQLPAKAKDYAEYYAKSKGE